jgi:hypothetical protein
MALMIVGTPPARAGNSNPGITPIQAHPHGQSYGHWAADWWTWALTTPSDVHPLLDSEEERACSGGQMGDVWFLGGDFVGTGAPISRNCTIPVGTALFFPLLNNAYFAFLNDPPDTRTEEYVRAAAACETPMTLTVVIDGKEVVEPLQYFVESPLFSVQLAPDNWLGIVDCEDPTPPGSPEGCAEQLLLSPAADNGYYLFLPPLPRGPHTIAWYGQWICPGYEEPLLTQDVVYSIEVVSGKAAQGIRTRP